MIKPAGRGPPHRALLPESDKTILRRGTDMELQWKEVSTDHIVTDEWIDFRKSVYRLPDGRDIGPFYTYSRRDYVVIVALDEEGRYICVKQFRQGIREVTTEFPVTHVLKKARPVWKKLPGWKCEIRGIKKYEDLPENCRNYIEFIEQQIGYPITMVSNGPGRDDIIYRESALSKK
jgi:hypothetical protein